MKGNPVSTRFNLSFLFALLALSLAVSIGCAAEGDILWQKNSLGENLESGPAVDASGNVYVIGNGRVYSYTSGGTLRWSRNTSGDDGYVYATCNTGIVHKINAATGIEDTSGSWPALGGIGEVFASVCFGADGTLYVNAEDYKLHALNTNGSQKWTYTFQGWGSDPLVRDDGMIIVMGQVNGAGRVCGIRDNGFGPLRCGIPLR
jgi:outer membrane protein assembly factor BamB